MLNGPTAAAPLQMTVLSPSLPAGGHPVPRHVLAETQVLHLARMSASGAATKSMCLATDLSEYMVKQIMLGDGLNDRQRLIFDKEHALALQIEHSGEVRHKQKMWEMSEAAYDVIQNILIPTEAAKHPDLAARTAWDVLKNAGVPVHSEKQVTGGMTANTQLNFYASEKGAQVLDSVTEALKSSNTAMTPLPPINAGNKHTHVSEAEAIVVQATAKAPPGDEPDEIPAPEGTPVAD